MSEFPKLNQLGVGVIGAGKVGCTLGNALRSHGHQIIGIDARSKQARQRVEDLLPGVPVVNKETIVERSQLVLLTVNDDQIEPLVMELAQSRVVPGGQIFMHTSGKYGIEVLAPLERLGAITLSMHPAMTFTGTSLDLKRLIGCPWAITAKAMFLPIAKALVMELEGHSFEVQEADRAAYHLALAHASNHLVPLINQALMILDHLQVPAPSQVLAPLLTATLEETLSRAAAALTGPISRADFETIRAHQGAIKELGIPALGATYQQLAKAAVEIASLEDEQKQALLKLLNQDSI